MGAYVANMRGRERSGVKTCNDWAEPKATGTKPQERVLHSEAARRGKYKDVFYKYSRRGAERGSECSAGQDVFAFAFIFWQLETSQVIANLKLLFG